MPLTVKSSMSTSLMFRESSEVFSGINHDPKTETFPILDIVRSEENKPSEDEAIIGLDLLKRSPTPEEIGEITHGFTPQLESAIEKLTSSGERVFDSPNQGKSKENIKQNKSILYIAEKEAGIRLNSGQKKLKGLKGSHYMCLSLHLAGFKNTEIAELCRKSYTWVGHTLRDPLVKAEIISRSLMLDSELFALQGKVVKALKGALDNTSEPGIQLRATEQWFKVHGRFQSTTIAEQFSAEDLVKKVLDTQKSSIAQAQAVVHVHVGEEKRSTVLIEGN